MSNNVHHLGVLSQNLNSIGETVTYLDGVLRNIESNLKLEDDENYTLGFLFSSRGSFPFLKALDFISKELRPGLNLSLIPHVFSLENLIEIVSDYDRLRYKNYQPVMASLYEDISNRMNFKIKQVARKHPKFILSDWDEVCSGSNISERIKIYNRLNLGKDIPFDIISFISERGKLLDPRNVKSFKRSFKRSPQNFSTYDVLMENPITWSDDEILYSKLGFEYPGIAVPEFSYISNFVKSSFMPQFYKSFFNIFGKLLSQTNESLDYKLTTPTMISSQYEHLLDEENILNSSHGAFMKSLYKIERAGGLKDLGLVNAEYDFDLEKGVVLNRKNGKVILNRNIPVNRRKSLSFDKFRSPFTLVYNPLIDDSGMLDSLLSYFQSQIKDSFQLPSHLVPSGNIFSSGK